MAKSIKEIRAKLKLAVELAVENGAFLNEGYPYGLVSLGSGVGTGSVCLLAAVNMGVHDSAIGRHAVAAERLGISTSEAVIVEAGYMQTSAYVEGRREHSLYRLGAEMRAKYYGGPHPSLV